MAVLGYMAQFGPNPLKIVYRERDNGTICGFIPWHAMEVFFDMANPRKSKNRTPFGNITFVSYKMDKETQKKFNAWFEASGNTLIDAVVETLQGDYRIGLSWDTDHDCFTASLTGRDESLNPSKCITMRSKDWHKALGAVVYVHTVVFDGEIWDASEESDLV